MIPDGLFDNNTGVTNFSALFSVCTSLTGITEGIFDNNTLVTQCQYIFNNCTSLLSIPDTIFDNCPNIDNFQNSFYSCNSITGPAPELWVDFPTATTTTGCFLLSTVTNLATIPAAWGGGGA